ncbi:protein of unknown function [Shewanella benthica]|uniref:Response regulatory domain-containing protein n=1 Tax=Shewanella benthica TaxID=43661 RepID=A0A330LZL7_9GAMM|nr:protein of unknown function [Shewanella benthica]
MRILLVEDDIERQNNLKQHLLDANFSLDVASDSENSLFQGNTRRPLQR